MSIKCLRCGAGQEWIDGNRRADESIKLDKANTKIKALQKQLDRIKAVLAEGDGGDD